jgi:hypothetical protein
MPIEDNKPEDVFRGWLIGMAGGVVIWTIIFIIIFQSCQN